MPSNGSGVSDRYRLCQHQTDIVYDRLTLSTSGLHPAATAILDYLLNVRLRTRRFAISHPQTEYVHL